MHDTLNKVENLNFLLYASSRLAIRLIKPELDSLDLTFPQYLVLKCLCVKDSIKVDELSRQLYLDTGTLTPLLKRMEKMQLITRIRSTADERMVIIAVTEKGQALQAGSSIIENKSQCHGVLTAEEAKDLKQFLAKILNYFSINK